jgi:membrane-associated phospholipid phosphatase
MLQLLEENIIILLQKYNCLKYLKYFTRAFDYDFVSIILIILYLGGSIKNKDMYIILIGIIFIYCLKIKYQRKRPHVNNKKIKKLNDRYIDSNSFPSGHTFTSEIIKLILISNFNLQYTEQQFLSLISYLVALSRVYLGDHYITDVGFSIIFARIYNIVVGSLFRLFFSMVS